MMNCTRARYGTSLPASVSHLRGGPADLWQSALNAHHLMLLKARFRVPYTMSWGTTRVTVSIGSAKLTPEEVPDPAHTAEEGTGLVRTRTIPSHKSQRGRCA